MDENKLIFLLVLASFATLMVFFIARDLDRIATALEQRNRRD